jgi:hypothetical protein
MNHNRLDNVLSRNRSNRVRDLAIAAFLPLVVLFSGMAVGAKLPALSSAPRPGAAESAHIAARAAAEVESNAMWQAALDEQSDTQPLDV